MNTIEALEYLRNNPGSVVSTIGGARIDMSVVKDLFDYNKSTFVEFTLYHDDGRTERINFSEWVQLDMEWEVSKEVRYYVKVKVPVYLTCLVAEEESYLNYTSLDNRYFLSNQRQVSTYFKTTFTRDEIEEFGIEHPEVRREDLEFIEVVE